ncbi:hypothetical protein CHUAL_013932 [Chamberlinius hualienensis]
MDNTRAAMSNYWQCFQPTLTGMMLDENAEIIAKYEQSEILSYLPDLKNKTVLELGSGIGRFTGIFAEKASEVFTIDFMANFIEKNKEINGHHSNITFLQADVTQLQLPYESYDMVFTNWLFMYLNDTEVKDLILNILRWLKKDGYLFVRESCFHFSGDGVLRPTVNPTFYRHPSFYLNNLSLRVGNGDSNHITYFHLTKVTSLKSYIKCKNNPNQLCFLLKKMEVPKASSDSYLTFQSFLDDNQYTQKGILKYEKIFGQSFVSTGGKQTTEEFCADLQLQPGQTVLDVGCGIGGSAFFMAKKYGVSVHGVDLSSNMITIALERQAKSLIDHKIVSFEISDITQQNCEENSYDVIYSRDTILHIKDKKLLFQQFHKWLKPGGRLLITDYCCGAQEHSQEFKEYVKQRGYYLLTVKDYGNLLKECGFQTVISEDRTKQFIDILQLEVTRFKNDKEEFLKEFDEDAYNEIVNGWLSKVQRCKGGNQAWGLFKATK